ncbi:Hypothetical Protein FCC1311_077282 [Hondaea fermentalgiana]|uniref:Uncharacterized protein n=1 Tax=Hondaea fermentalgiana TaxID=2315210 RepID=A0A2R5GUD5_9STRA|nr:Hypothetical Protein FCC1311_077282 [Hondaea fermentalgiana]|eukprot:GBG31504.1 Hypothetical Protein FCC1311_077282 [Hondaea fermentalgiana]
MGGSRATAAAAGEDAASGEDAAWHSVWRLCSTASSPLGALGGSHGSGLGLGLGSSSSSNNNSSSAGGGGGGGEKTLQGHVSLTRFNMTRHRTICNLQPGEYKLYIFVFTGGVNDEDERNAMSPGPNQGTTDAGNGAAESSRTSRSGSAPGDSNRRHSLGLRNVLRTATFGKLGKLDVRADWELVSFPENNNSAGETGVSAGAQVRRLQQFTEVVSLEDVPVRELTFTILPEDLPCQAYFSLSSTSTVTTLNIAAQLYRRDDSQQEASKQAQQETGDFDEASSASKVITIPTADRVDVLEAILLEGSERSRGLLLTAAFLGFALGISSLSSMYLVFVFLVVLVTARGSTSLFSATAGKGFDATGAKASSR